nr:hypothetical protein [Denitromonas sp.]
HVFGHGRNATGQGAHRGQLRSIPTVAEYMAQVESLKAQAGEVYRYMNFDQIEAFQEVADTVEA